MFTIYFSVIFVVAATFASQVLLSSISDGKAEYPLTEPRGIVNLTNCGGGDTLVETRVSGCDAYPCDLTAETEIEIDFLLRADIPNAEMSFNATTTGKDPFFRLIPLGTLMSGRIHTLYPLERTDFFTSDEVTIKVEVMTARLDVEICVSGVFNQDRVDPTTTNPTTTNPTTTAATTNPTTTAPTTTTPTTTVPATTTTTTTSTTPRPGGGGDGGAGTKSASICMVTVLLIAMFL